jgi:hypothetical protein
MLITVRVVRRLLRKAFFVTNLESVIRNSVRAALPLVDTQQRAKKFVRTPSLDRGTVEEYRSTSVRQETWYQFYPQGEKPYKAVSRGILAHEHLTC